jgi:hypothetical protein
MLGRLTASAKGKREHPTTPVINAGSEPGSQYFLHTVMHVCGHSWDGGEKGKGALEDGTPRLQATLEKVCEMTFRITRKTGRLQVPFCEWVL